MVDSLILEKDNSENQARQYSGHKHVANILSKLLSKSEHTFLAFISTTTQMSSFRLFHACINRKLGSASLFIPGNRRCLGPVQASSFHQTPLQTTNDTMVSYLQQSVMDGKKATPLSQHGDVFKDVSRLADLFYPSLVLVKENLQLESFSDLCFQVNTSILSKSTLHPEVLAAPPAVTASSSPSIINAVISAADRRKIRPSSDVT